MRHLVPESRVLREKFRPLSREPLIYSGDPTRMATMVAQRPPSVKHRSGMCGPRDTYSPGLLLDDHRDGVGLGERMGSSLE